MISILLPYKEQLNDHRVWSTEINQSHLVLESQVRFTNIHGWTIIDELNDVHLTKRTYVRMGGLPLFFLLDEPLEYLSFLLFDWRLLWVILSFLNTRVGLGALCFLVPSGSTNVASSISFLAWNLGLAPLISSLLRSRLEISPSIAIAILLCKVLSRIGLQLNQNWPEINKSWTPWSWNKPKIIL